MLSLDYFKSRQPTTFYRSLSPFNFRFQITNIDTKISLDVVSFMYETVWYHFHAVIESIFNGNNIDMNAKFLALDILCYCLTSAIFLVRICLFRAHSRHFFKGIYFLGFKS